MRKIPKITRWERVKDVLKRNMYVFWTVASGGAGLGLIASHTMLIGKFKQFHQYYEGDKEVPVHPKVKKLTQTVRKLHHISWLYLLKKRFT